MRLLKNIKNLLTRVGSQIANDLAPKTAFVKPVLIYVNSAMACILSVIVLLLIMNSVVNFITKSMYPLVALIDIPGQTDDKKIKIPFPELLSMASVDRGKVVAKKCASCHTFEQNGGVKTGPNLWGILSAKIGSKESFAYSKNMKAKEGTWDYETLNKFLKKPTAYIEGTKMNFIGLRKDEDRAAMIIYLRTLGKEDVPLPPIAEPSQEDLAVAPATSPEQAK